MMQVCHRCGDNLVPDELYCPHCGAPQLRVEESEVLPAGQESVLQQSLDHLADMMRWRSAVAAALLVAVPAALLSDFLSLGALWVFLGGFFTVSLYRRRTASSTNGRIGWRIGGLMGCIAAILWMALEAASMLVERYVLHQGGLIDATLRNSVQKAIATMNQQNPTFAHQYPWFAHYWLSSSGIATLYLCEISLLAISMVVFSALGGALGGRYQGAKPFNAPSM